MDLAKIKIVGGPRVQVTDEEVDQAAAKLKTHFPDGYRQYVTTLGEGTLANFVRVYPPWRILAELEEWRDRIRQYWFWDAGADVLSDEKAEQSIIVADTLNGDELIFHPSEPNRLFVLPREDEVIFEAGESLTEAVQWLCGSGKLTRRFKPREFEPFDSRTLQQKVPSESATPRKEREQSAQCPTQNLASGVVAPVRRPDEVLQALFVSLEAWEMDAYSALSNAPGEKFRDLEASVQEKFRETVEPFISEAFDVGKPCSFGSPAHYGKTGPRIVNVQVSGDTAEVSTCGHNMYPSDEPSQLFRLVRHSDAWRVDGMWEITKSGRRKRVKMFL